MFLGLTGGSDKETLKEMLCGMLVYGAVGQLVIWLFIRGSWQISLGWWLGVLVAMLCGYQMWWSLNKALDLTVEDARKKMTAYSLMRYGIIIAIMAVVMTTQIVNPLAAVFGVFALKFGAYLQPLMHYIRKRFSAGEN